MSVLFKKLRENAIIPKRSTRYSVGFDLFACIEGLPITLHANTTLVIKTGVKMVCPRNHFGMICSRSGLAAKNDICVLNAPGIIDFDYDKELMVILHNFGKSFIINHGDRVAQFLFVATPSFVMENIVEQERTGGLGSTGT